MTVAWRERAACVGKSEVFFAADEECDTKRGGGAATEQAKSVCAGCAVVEECRAAAVGEPFGVWGGLTPKERHRDKERRMQRRACEDCGTPMLVRRPSPIWQCAACVRGAEGDPVVASINGWGRGVTHGRVSTYRRGCRCESCTAASRAYQASYRRRVGTSLYTPERPAQRLEPVR